MKSRSILFVILVFFAYTASSQATQNKENPQAQKQEFQKAPAKTINVKGRVISSVTKKPVQSGFVLVVGTNIGTLTDQDGNFLVQVPEGAKQLTFSAKGYQAQKASINTKKEMKINLIPKDK